MANEKGVGFDSAAKFLLNVALLVLLVAALTKVVAPEVREALSKIVGETKTLEIQRNALPKELKKADLSGGQ